MIAICDSGLGGLDIAARLAPKLGGHTAVFFNVWPDPARGFSKMSDSAERVAVWERAFAGMEKFGFERLVIACNTLSVVHRKSRHRDAPRVTDIVGAAVRLLGWHLRAHGERRLLMLGTAETVESGCHRKLLIDSGIAPDRILQLACPGLATLIESDPNAPAVGEKLADYADAARRSFGDLGDCALGLCCTHFGYCASEWEKRFAPAALLDPNAELAAELEFPARSGAPQFSVVSKIPLSESKLAAMAPFFHRRAPELAEALAHYTLNPDLF